jgi:heat shock protein HslJ
LAVFWLIASLAGAQNMQNAMAHHLADTKWLAEQIGSARLAGDIQSSLEFGTPDRVTGKAGCNRFTGAFHRDGQKLSFGQFATTRMMCPAPMMEQEEAFLKALATVRSFELTADGKLLLFDAAAAPVLRFTPL